MHSNFKKAVVDTNRVKISPISSVDGEILSEIVDGLDACGERLLSEILKKYKSIPDEEIYKMLCRFNVDYSPIIEDEEEKQPLKRMVCIKDEIQIDIKFLFSIRKVDSYDNKTFRNMYSIIINEDEGDKSLYSNTYINFVSEKQRDFEWNKLRKNLEQYNIVFI